ncbi:DUF2071 domain-containing protein [Aquibacillus kalidii]|nr:DUF2071 domain-containing protein [Aquibacillus kalidii]
MLLAHWMIDIVLIRPYIPESLESDTYDGMPGLLSSPFEMRNIRVR